MDDYESRRIDYLVDKLIDLDDQLKIYRKMYSDQQDLIRDLCRDRDVLRTEKGKLQKELNILAGGFGEALDEALEAKEK